MTTQTPETPAVAEGWKDIATAIRTSVRAAQMRASRNYDPLPVRMGHKGPWAYVNALRDWVYRQDMAYTASLKLRDRARLGVDTPKTTANTAEKIDTGCASR